MLIISGVGVGVGAGVGVSVGVGVGVGVPSGPPTQANADASKIPKMKIGVTPFVFTGRISYSGGLLSAQRVACS